MPKIRVNPSASKAYCAPRLTPMMAAWMNWSIRLLRLHLLPFHAQVLAVLDDADTEWELQFLGNTQLLLAAPVTVADVGIVHRHRAQCRGDLLGVVGAGDRDRFQGHARGRQIGPHGRAANRILAEEFLVLVIDGSD